MTLIADPQATHKQKQAEIGSFCPQNCIKLHIPALDFRRGEWHNRTAIEHKFYKGELRGNIIL